MTRLETINGKNVWDILKLKVGKSQQDFVASNDVSMIEAYVALTHHGTAFPFGIYDGETPVGFLMIGYNLHEDWDDEIPDCLKNGYYVWRFMIDKKYQGKGYGRAAMTLALDYIKTFPCGKADCCWLSYEPENEVAGKLYASLGFDETGETDGDEDHELPHRHLSDEQLALGKARLMEAYRLIAAHPGIPCVYYGDEAGLRGSADPYCRGTFPWGHEDKALQTAVRDILSCRQRRVFQTGSLRVWAENADTLVIIREITGGHDVFGNPAEDDRAEVRIRRP